MTLQVHSAKVLFSAWILSIHIVMLTNIKCKILSALKLFLLEHVLGYYNNIVAVLVIVEGKNKEGNL